MISEHWLVSAARAYVGEGRQFPEDVRLDGDLAARWAAVSHAAGLDEAALADAVAVYFQIERADLSTIDPEFARELPEATARTALMLPMGADSHRAWVACVDPTDAAALDQIAFMLGQPVIARVASPLEIEAMLGEVHGEDAGPTTGWGKIPRNLLAAELVLRRTDGTPVQADSGATAKLLRELLRGAVHVNASDTHVQPYGTGAIVRNRIDGVLYRAVELPKQVHEYLIRHVKAVAGMDPTKRFVPQDGELRMELEHREIDMRLSVLPVANGERLVIRLLPQSQVRSLAMLRLPDAERVQLESIARSSAGLVLMTGPTGSGKTSLLYAMLAEINTPDINIMSVEEPVEYRLRGSSQINVDSRTGLTFARALRSILRQDPDVVMIGEIRDEETARIAAQAAMTGHLVMSTVHTLNALLSMVRMKDLGVTGTTLADSLRAVASQRLVRALCTNCRAPLDPQQASTDERRFADIRGVVPAWRAVGCESCRSTGFAGRVPVLEVIEISGPLQASLRRGDQEVESLELLAAESGARFLPEGFAERVTNGDTTVAEVLRVYGRGFFGRLQHYQNLRQAMPVAPASAPA